MYFVSYGLSYKLLYDEFYRDFDRNRIFMFFNVWSYKKTIILSSWSSGESYLFMRFRCDAAWYMYVRYSLRDVDIIYNSPEGEGRGRKRETQKKKEQDFRQWNDTRVYTFRGAYIIHLNNDNNNNNNLRIIIITYSWNNAPMHRIYKYIYVCIYIL